MLGVVAMLVFSAYFFLPALLAWAVAYGIVGHSKGIAEFGLYVANTALGIVALWLAIMWVPLFRLFGPPDAWFWFSFSIFGAVVGTASAQRMTKPIGHRTLL